MSTSSSTPAGGWYADPLDGSLLRWWTGSTWSEQTTPAASVPSAAAPVFTTAPPVLSAVPPLDEPYAPPNSVFRMPEAGSGETSSPEWSALPDIALIGVPVQRALTSASSVPPIDQLFPANGSPTVSAELFRSSSANPAPVPPPVGQLFPGLVPSAPPAMAVPPTPAPTLYAEPPAPVAPAPGANSPVAAPILGATGFAPRLPPAPTEYWPSQGTPPPGAAQPGPGSYVPFDPSSVHLQPVPMIPFSSRDPHNFASTARPGMRTYTSAPVGPSGSTWTGGVAFMLLAPLLTAGGVFGWTQLVTTGVVPISSGVYLGLGAVVIGLLALAAAQFDRNALANRGYFDLASPFWVLLGPLIYLIVRATRLHGQGRGAPGAILLWLVASVASAAVVVVAMTFLSAPTPDHVAQIQSELQAQLAAKNVVATVSCPTVTSLVPGSSFGCTVKTATASLPIQVTMIDWQGDFSVTSTSGSGVTA